MPENVRTREPFPNAARAAHNQRVHVAVAHLHRVQQIALHVGTMEGQLAALTESAKRGEVRRRRLEKRSRLKGATQAPQHDAGTPLRPRQKCGARARNSREADHAIQIHGSFAAVHSENASALQVFFFCAEKRENGSAAEAENSAARNHRQSRSFVTNQKLLLYETGPPRLRERSSPLIFADIYSSRTFSHEVLVLRNTGFEAVQ